MMLKLKRRCLIAAILSAIGFVMFFAVTTWTLVIPMIGEIKSFQDLGKTFDLFPKLPYWGILALCIICDVIFYRLSRMLYIFYRQIYKPLIEYNDFILALSENKIPPQLKLNLSSDAILTPLGQALNLVRDRIITNLNRLRQSQEREENLKKSSETANYLKSIIIGRLTPDIRQPLQSIKGFDDIMRTKSDRKNLSENEIKHYSEGIQRNIDNISTLIAQIVKFVEFDTTGKQHLIASVRTEDLLNDAVKINTLPCKERGVTIHTLFESSMPERIVVNEDFFVQALLIISRAVFRASEHGENLYIYCKSDDSKVYFHVRDSKKAPCREKLGAIFNNFNRANASFDDYNNLSTTVLGLFFIELELSKIGGSLIVTENVHANNEVIMVFDKMDILSGGAERGYGHNADNQIYTPVFQGSADSTEQVHDSGGNYKVLLGEDNPDNAMVMTEILQLYGFRVVAEKSSEDIIKSIANEEFDGVILSNSMRHKHLLKLIESIRSDKQNSAIPIAVIASKINQQKKKELKDLGVSFIMLKPINFIDFINKLKHFIYYFKLKNQK